MRQSERMESYTRAVLAQVRWKQAHETIRGELAAHLEDQMEAFIKSGLPRDEAEARAVAEMGDPAEIGMRLDASYRPKPTAHMLLPLGALVLLGVVCRALFYNLNGFGWLKFLAALAIGGGCFALLYQVNLYRFVRWSPYACVAVAAAMALAYGSVYFVGQPRWNDRLNFSNYAVCALPVLLAGLAYSLRGQGMRGLLLCGAAAAVPSLALFFTPSCANAVELVFACLFVLTAAILAGVFGGQKARLLLVAWGGVAAAGLALCLMNQGYMLLRLTGVFHPEEFAQAEGWFSLQVRETVAGAKLLGSGADTAGALAAGFSAGASAPAYTINDYLLTTVLHRYGWIPAAALLLLLLAFLMTGFRRAFCLSSLLGRMLGGAVMASFAVQTLGYAAENFGLNLGGPLPLPFLSGGNTALAVNLALAGLLLSLFRTDGLYADAAPERMPRLRIRVEWER